MTTKNGCWNCCYGGNLKILRTLLRSLAFEHDIHLTSKCQQEINEKIQLEENRCKTDYSYQAEPGFICEKWKYDERGFKEDDFVFGIESNHRLSR